MISLTQGPLESKLWFIPVVSHVWMWEVKVAQSCLTLCDPMDCSPWNSLGQNTGVGTLSLLQGIFPTQGVNSGFPHYGQILYQLSHKEAQRMWVLNHNEDWVMKTWCFWTVVLVKTLESPLDNKETKPVHPKGKQPWIFMGRTDVEAKTPILWPPDVKSRLILKRPWCWERLKAGGEGDDRGWDG